MGVIIEAGETYTSPKFDKLISVLAIDKEDDTGYTLDILWVDKTTGATTPDSLQVSHADANSWNQVEL